MISSRARGHLSCGDDPCNPVNAGREAGCGLVVSRCNRPELLDFAEEILDPVPFPIGVSVKGARKRSVFLRGNHRLDSVFRKPI